MKTALRILIAFSCLTTSLRAEPLAWWRLDAEAAPVPAAAGGPDLKWWSQSAYAYAPSETGPAESLYRAGVAPAKRGFAAATSLRDAPGGLFGNASCQFSGWPGGLTVEGFFSTVPVKAKHEYQAVITCGDGWFDASWALRLVDGHPAFAVFREGDSAPLAQVEIGDDVRDGNWHFVVARIHPAAGGRPASISLAVTAADGRRWFEELALPEGTAIRPHAKPPIIGRSSLYIDSQPNYKGTWDTFQGAIADVRISPGALPDDRLLGSFKR